MTYPVLPSGATSTYFLQRSIRLRAAATAYFSRTPATTTNQRTFTISMWLKLGNITTFNRVYVGRTGANFPQFGITIGNSFTGSGVVIDQYTTGAAIQMQLISTNLYRDIGSWYHLVVAIDTTQATASNRVKAYINGVQITSFSTATYPAQNLQLNVNTTNTQIIGADPANGGYFDGYLDEINSIDGQQLTPSSFGETNPVTGVWQPKRYTGAYGANGFLLKFEDNSAATAAAIGKDSSGNNNNFTPTNISLTAGTTYDSMLDVPTLTSTTQANYPTLNAIGPGNAGGTYTNANLSFASAVANQWRSGISTMFLPSGKFYFEATIQVLGANNYLMIGACGIQTNATVYGNYTGLAANGWSVQCNGTTGGTKYNNGGATNVSNATFANWLVNDVLQCAVDVTNGRIWFGKNNTWLEGVPSAGTGASFTNLTGPIAPSISCYSSTAQLAVNFGQRPFTYTAPTGFGSPLNAYNLPTPAVPNGSLQMGIITRAGTSSNSITVSGVNFMPDLIWTKNRSISGTNNLLSNTVSGVGNSVVSNSTAVQVFTNNIASVTSTGYVLGQWDNNNNGPYNYVDWLWKANSTPAVSNTSGTITSSVSANTTAGFSISTYTGNGVNGATVGHGLGVAPAFGIWKVTSGTIGNWVIYHQSLGATKGLNFTTVGAQTTAVFFNNTAPTSSVWSLGTVTDVNRNTSTYVLYSFSQIAGYSSFGTYTGNGVVDGPFIYTGFRPRFVLFKRTDTNSSWEILDSSRNPFNTVSNGLQPDLGNAESSPYSVDFLSNGFKARITNTDINASGGTYIYAAFAENPFQYALAR